MWTVITNAKLQDNPDLIREEWLKRLLTELMQDYKEVNVPFTSFTRINVTADEITTTSKSLNLNCKHKIMDNGVTLVCLMKSYR
jgi:hypothetical protein